MGSFFSGATHAEVPPDVKDKVEPIEYTPAPESERPKDGRVCVGCEEPFFVYFTPSTNCNWCGCQLCTRCCPNRHLLGGKPGCPDCTRKALVIKRKELLSAHLSQRSPAAGSTVVNVIQDACTVNGGDYASVPSKSYTVLRGEGSGVEVRAWIKGVDVERAAHEQLLQLSRMGEVIHHPIVVMPDVHTGHGATVGTVIPTTRALIPSSVGVDIGCGMIAVKTSLTQEDLPASLAGLRLAIEVAVPHGRTHNGRSGLDAGSWRGEVPKNVANIWKTHLQKGFEEICAMQRLIESSNHITHLGTLGGGNHFIELCVDDGVANDARQQHLWVMLHSGSRGVGNRIGSLFIELAKKDMGSHIINLPSSDLAYLREGSVHFDQYVKAVDWAQCYAKWNREIMLQSVLQALQSYLRCHFTVDAMAINCHHNYIERVELSPQKQVWITRKGATSARAGELAVIPGSMGARSYIVRGKGNHESYASCSHGAGRRYSRGEAKRRFTIEDHEAATANVECRKDTDVLDETPLAYKNIDDVVRAQDDLVEVVCTLKQLLCVKG